MASNYNKPEEFTPTYEKLKDSFGLSYARYIDNEHFSQDSWVGNRSKMIENELYRTGRQSSSAVKKLVLGQKTKSFGHLDFTPLPIIPKYTKLAKKNLSLELFSPKCNAIDNFSMEMRKKERNELISKMINQDIDSRTSELTGIDFNPKGFIPASDEDIDVYMEVESKLPQEIAIEQAIKVVHEANHHDEIVNKLADDVITYGKCIIRDKYDPQLGVVEERVSPPDFISSYDGSEMPDDRNVFYNGHLEMVSLIDIRRTYNVPEKKLMKWAKKTTRCKQITKLKNRSKWSDISSTMVEVLFFEFRTTIDEKYRIKTGRKGKKTIKIVDPEFEFNKGNIETVTRQKEVWMEGVWIVDTDFMLEYGIRTDMVMDSLKKVRSSYCSYDTNEESLVRKMIPFANKMGLAAVKMDQMIAAARPKGVAVNISSLLSIPSPDGSGDSLSYLNVVKRFDETGNQLYRLDEFAAGQGIPITELENGLPRDIGKYVDIWNFNLQEIHNAIGFNPLIAGQGSTARVSTESNKIALNSSIKAIDYIKDAVLSVEKRHSENIILRIQDIDKHDRPFKKIVSALGSYNMRALMELESLHPFKYSLMIEMLPSVEQEQDFNEDMAISLKAGQITVPDKIDIQNITNLKMRSLMLKRRIRENQEKAQEMEMQRIQQTQQSIQMDLNKQKELLDFKGNVDARLSDQEFLQKKELLEMEMTLRGFIETGKGQSALGREFRDRDAKKEIATFNQKSMDDRQQKKLDAMAEDKLSKDSVKNMKKK